MKVIILAAGYGTRLQSIIGDRPKALVEIGGATVLGRLMSKLAPICGESDIFLVSNARYFSYFEDWNQTRGAGVTLLNDGSTTADNRLGAVGDIRFVLHKAGIHDDILIVAADNIFTFELTDFVEHFRKRQEVTVGVWYNENIEDQKHRGVVVLDDSRLTAFAEKPEEPTSHWAAAPLYLLPGKRLDAIDDYFAAGGNPDAPGYLMEYLVGLYPVYGWKMPSAMLDVGNPNSLAQTRASLE